MFGETLLLGDLTTWIKPLGPVAVGALIAVAALAAIGLVVRLVLPKVAAIGWTTAKEAFAQPIYWVVMVAGAFLLICFLVVPYNTFGEDVKVLKDQGLAILLLTASFLGVWNASVSISEEIEGRTALTLLSKPISRWQFIFGKFAGILIPVAVLFIILGVIFLGVVSYKVVYDARETGQLTPEWTQCQEEVVQVAPGVALAFMEAVVLTSIAIAIATRLPMLPNLLICASIYVVGNLVPLLLSSTSGQLEFLTFIAQLIATVLPVLDHFNIAPAIATGKQVSLSYLGWAGLYCVLYSSVAMLLALLMFEDRDLA